MTDEEVLVNEKWSDPFEGQVSDTSADEIVHSVRLFPNRT